MVFDDAMASHIVWKLRLTRFVDGQGGAGVDRATAGRADLCTLGRWLGEEGPKYRDEQAYADLERTHVEFHRHAAEIIALVDSGDHAGARAIVDGPLEKASREIINAIVGLRRKVLQDTRPAA